MDLKELCKTDSDHYPHSIDYLPRQSGGREGIELKSSELQFSPVKVIVISMTIL